MRIKTDGTHEYRLDRLRRVMQRTTEGTKSGAFVASRAEVGRVDTGERRQS